jgi:hypothetical protein
MKIGPLSRDILALLVLCAAAACGDRPPIVMPGGPAAKPAPTGAAGNGNGSGGGPAMEGCCSGAPSGGAGAPGSGATDLGGLPMPTAGAGGGAIAIPDPNGGASGQTACTPTAFSNPYGGSGGGCLADSGLYANVPKDPDDTCPCSRAAGRARPPAHLLCPPGSGANAQATIGPDGGSIILATNADPGGALRLDVPRGALDAPTVISVTELQAPTPTGFTDYTPLYLLEPLGLHLATPAQVTVQWDIVIAAGFGYSTPSSLAIYHSVSQNRDFGALGDSTNTGGASKATIDALDYLFVGYPASLDPEVCMAGSP